MFKRNSPLFLWVLLGVLFISWILLQWAAPKPVDWSLNFKPRSKSPYGTFLLYNSLHDIFPSQAIDQNRETLYYSKKLDDKYKSIVIICDSWQTDSLEIAAILDEVETGTNLFISANNFPALFKDTLDFSVDRIYQRRHVSFRLLNPEYYRVSYDFENLPVSSSILAKDSSKVTLLGEYLDGGINFIEKKWGKGKIFIHTVPYAFSNVAFKNTRNLYYASQSLSYLPVAPVLYHSYPVYSDETNRSLLEVVFAYETLRWAYYLVVIFVLILLIFGSRRKVRPIPVKQILKNSSLDFASAVSSLYLDEKAFQELLFRRIALLKDNIRLRYNIRFDDPASHEHLQKRVGIDEELFASLVYRIRRVEESSAKHLSKNEVVEISNLIDEFYNISNLKHGA